MTKPFVLVTNVTSALLLLLQRESSVTVLEGVDVTQTNMSFFRQQLRLFATHILRCSGTPSHLRGELTPERSSFCLTPTEPFLFTQTSPSGPGSYRCATRPSLSVLRSTCTV